MRLLIAGTGSIGRRHLRNLLALGERDIAFLRTGRGTLPPDDLEEFPAFTDMESALAWRPQGVVVANPTACHVAVATAAARAGCSLLVEKPVSHDGDGLAALADALASGGGRLLMGYQLRFHPTLRRLVDLLTEGAIGRPFFARAEWGEYLPDWHPWEDYRQGYAARADLGGGVVRTLCHPFDYLRWALGDAPRLTWAHTGRSGLLEIDVEDWAEAGFSWDSGVTAAVHLDYLARPATHTLRLWGTGGALEWDGLSGALVQREPAGAEAGRWLPPAGFERNHLFLDEMRHFLAVLRGETHPCCTLADGVASLEMALGILEGA